MKILFTGFLPFSSHKENPAEVLAKELAEAFACPYRILPVSYQRAPVALQEAIEEEKPDFILSLGLHGSADALRLERTAYNWMDAPLPDEDGESMQGCPIHENLADKIDNPILLPSLLDPLQGFPFLLSDNPGRYICNLIYFHDLWSGIPSLFVHLPPFATLPKEKQKEALLALIPLLKEAV